MKLVSGHIAGCLYVYNDPPLMKTIYMSTHMDGWKPIEIEAGALVLIPMDPFSCRNKAYMSITGHGDI
jgi:hypothetical protein